MPWFYGWNVLLFGWLYQALSFGLVFYGFAVMVVPFRAAFDVSLSDVMLATVALQLGIGIYSAPLGKMIDHRPAHWVVATGGLCLSAGFALVAWTASFWGFLLAYATLFPVGLILAGTLAAQSLAVKWFVTRRGLAIGLSALGASIGGFLCPPLVSFLFQADGWQNAFWIFSVVSLVAICPLALLLLRRQPPVAAVAGPAVSAVEQKEWTTAAVLRQPSFWVIVGGFIPVVAAFTAIQLNIGAYAEDRGFGGTQAAYLVSLIAMAMMAGKVFFAAQSDRIAHRWLYLAVAAGHALVIIGLIVFIEFHYIAAVALLFGFSVGGVLPLVGAMVARQFGGRSFGLVMGLVTPFVTASSAMGPIFAAYMRDVTGGYAGAFTVFLCLLAPSLLVVALLAKQERQPAGAVR